ncbi:MAG: epoxyqueuosine reductase [Desulfofustis sp.]|nr:epoxyqueuosine reductase [Desulfofustis sp.]
MIERHIIDRAIGSGATLAGLADMEDLKSSSSHLIFPKMGSHTGIDATVDAKTLPDQNHLNDLEAKGAVLVVALSHPEDQPELDWWDGHGTPGNRQLIDIVERTRQQLETDFGLRTRRLHYYVEKGGVFLKDAAVLAGLGCVGRNNLLITPKYGPRVRLRALFLEAKLCPTGPLSFDPCAACPGPCRKVCPENALSGETKLTESMEFPVDLPARDGAYSRTSCTNRMLRDDAEGGPTSTGEMVSVKYCRRCELVCPVGRAKDGL